MTAVYHTSAGQYSMDLKGFMCPVKFLTGANVTRRFIRDDYNRRSQSTQPWFKKSVNFRIWSVNIPRMCIVGTRQQTQLHSACLATKVEGNKIPGRSREKSWRGGNKQVPGTKTRRCNSSRLKCVSGYFSKCQTRHLRANSTSTKMTVRRMLWRRRSWSPNWKKWVKQ